MPGFSQPKSDELNTAVDSNGPLEVKNGKLDVNLDSDSPFSVNSNGELVLEIDVTSLSSTDVDQDPAKELVVERLDGGDF